ncbi:class I SAM-dependent methyltransferase [Nitratifractor sp.]|uniref:class I SAM-dependent methyltransferase n=1 Tax=Nitratifractor sp. TaxID=2268144 RepID=UPI0025DE9A39|nr:class I SAM-dependent methyltransferase [Nitratifractor sp.]
MQPKKKSNQWNPDSYSKHTDFVYKLASPLVNLLDPRKGEMILDAGCGEGSLTLEIMRRGARVIGVDQSPEMVQKAREKGLEAYEVSLTESLPWRVKFDAVFSNAVLHWIPQAREAVRNIATSLKPGGRFVAEFGGAGNVAHIVAAIKEVFARHPEFGEPDIPWYFPAPQSYREILEAEGFKVEWIDLIPRPTPMEDVRYWLEIFANGIIGHLSPEQKVIFLEECRMILRESFYDPEKGWVIDYVRLRFKAWKR